MLYITKRELALIYKENNEGKELSNIELSNAVSDYNGRLDNFAEFLVEEILEGIKQGDYRNEETN